MFIVLTDEDADELTFWRIQRASELANVEAFIMAEGFSEDEPIPYVLTQKALDYLARVNGGA
jgi:hypothetical protein